MVYFSFFWSRRVKKFSFLFIYLFIYLFICLFSLAAIRTWLRVEIAAEREVVHFLTWWQTALTECCEGGRGGGENKDRKAKWEAGNEVRVGGAAVRRAWQCPFLPKYSALLLNLAPDSSFQQKHGVSTKIKRERESYSKIWLSISRVNTNVLTLS